MFTRARDISPARTPRVSLWCGLLLVLAFVLPHAVGLAQPEGSGAFNAVEDAIEGTGAAAVEGTGAAAAEGTGAFASEGSGSPAIVAPEAAPPPQDTAPRAESDAEDAADRGLLEPISADTARRLALGSAVREARDAGEAAARAVFGQAWLVSDDKRDGWRSRFTAAGDDPGVLGALLGLPGSDLGDRASVERHLAAVRESLVAEGAAPDDARAAAARLRVLAERARLDEERLRSGFAEGGPLGVWFRMERYLLYAQEAREAEGDVRAAEHRLDYLRRAEEALQARLVALAAAELAAASAEPELDLAALDAEIEEERQRLENETSRTDRIAEEAAAAEQRAAEERASASALAAQWTAVSAELERITNQRRLEEARLNQVTLRKERFRVQQTAFGQRAEAIVAAPASDETRAVRADRLYDELFRVRQDARETVSITRAQMRAREVHIDDLREAVQQRRGALQLARDERDDRPNSESARRTVELREQQLQAAEAAVELETFALEIDHRNWQLTERQIYFCAQTTDRLIPFLSSARRDKVYEITGANLLEAQQNIRDRLIGFSLVARDRMERMPELQSWVATREGMLWVGRVLLGLFLILVGARRMRRLRDKLLLDQVIRRIEPFAFVQRHIRGALKCVELLRAAFTPFVAWLALQLVLSGPARTLTEVRLVESALTKLLLLWFLVGAIRSLFLPRALREERKQDVATWAVDLWDLQPSTASLVSLTFRVWAVYAVVASILIETGQFVFGMGFTPHLFETLLLWGQFGLVYFLCFVWRDEIVEGFATATASIAARGEAAAVEGGAAPDADDEAPRRRVGIELLRRHKDRIYSVLFLVVLAVYVLAQNAWRFVRKRVLTNPFVRRIESSLLRRRIEAAQTRDIDVSDLDDAPQGFAPDCLAVFSVDHTLERALEVRRELSIEAALTALGPWREGKAGATIGVIGEPGGGSSTFLRQLEDTLAADETVLRYELPRRLTTEDAVIQQLVEIFGLEACADKHALIEALLAGPRRVAIIDDCEMLFLRAIHGFDALDCFLAVVSQTQPQIAWVIAFDNHAWEFINRVHDRRHHVKTIIRLAGLNELQVQRMIEQRAASVGLALDFSNLVVAQRAVQADGRYELVKTARGFFRILTDYCGGNPRVALHYWRSSLRPTGARTAEVVLFSRPDDSAIKGLGERQLFALTAIAQHGALSVPELSRVVDVAPGLCALDLSFLESRGLTLGANNGATRLAARYQRMVFTRLRDANLLYTGE